MKSLGRNRTNQRNFSSILPLPRVTISKLLLVYSLQLNESKKKNDVTKLEMKCIEIMPLACGLAIFTKTVVAKRRRF